MKEIGITRAIEEVSIDGKPFEIDLSDKKKQRHLEIALGMQKIGKELEKTSKIEDEKVLRKALEEIKQETKLFTDELLGDGAFDYIYEKTNNSTDETLSVVFDVLDYIHDKRQEKQKERFEKKRAKYVKKKR